MNNQKEIRYWPYAALAVVLLTIFVMAISLPDFWNYRYRVAALKSAQVNSATTVPNTNGTAILLSSNTVSTNQEAASNTDVPIKTSDIFETYGKLLTMLLGFVSVLGVFFGYFVRRSLREVEEDMRSHVNDNMNLWTKERDRLTTDVTNKLAEITKQEEKLTSMTKEFAETMTRAKKELEALNAAAKIEEHKLKPTEQKTSKIAASIDDDPSIPNT